MSGLKQLLQKDGSRVVCSGNGGDMAMVLIDCQERYS